MQPTRRQIVEILMRRGRATVDELAKELGITLMAVRLHLVVLERDGLVSRSTVRTGPGRPTLVYRLTEGAEDVFPKAYDDLANHLLAAAKSEMGTARVEQMCLVAAHKMAAELRERLGAADVAKRVAAIAQVRQEEGALADWENAENGYFLHNYSCPYYRVARVHREVCVLHRQVLREALEADVETMSCLLDGDLRCSHLVRVPAPAAVPTEVVAR
jgi:predicted ArsR family transcriptional regulator